MPLPLVQHLRLRPPRRALRAPLLQPRILARHQHAPGPAREPAPAPRDVAAAAPPEPAAPAALEKSWVVSRGPAAPPVKITRAPTMGRYSRDAREQEAGRIRKAAEAAGVDLAAVPPPIKIKRLYPPAKPRPGAPEMQAAKPGDGVEEHAKRPRAANASPGPRIVQAAPGPRIVKAAPSSRVAKTAPGPYIMKESSVSPDKDIQPTPKPVRRLVRGVWGDKYPPNIPVPTQFKFGKAPLIRKMAQGARGAAEPAAVETQEKPSGRVMRVYRASPSRVYTRYDGIMIKDGQDAAQLVWREPIWKFITERVIPITGQRIRIGYYHLPKKYAPNGAVDETRILPPDVHTPRPGPRIHYLFITEREIPITDGRIRIGHYPDPSIRYLPIYTFITEREITITGQRIRIGHYYLLPKKYYETRILPPVVHTPRPDPPIRHFVPEEQQRETKTRLVAFEDPAKWRIWPLHRPEDAQPPPPPPEPWMHEVMRSRKLLKSAAPKWVYEGPLPTVLLRTAEEILRGTGEGDDGRGSMLKRAEEMLEEAMRRQKRDSADWVPRTDLERYMQDLVNRWAQRDSEQQQQFWEQQRQIYAQEISDSASRAEQQNAADATSAATPEFSAEDPENLRGDFDETKTLERLRTEAREAAIEREFRRRLEASAAEEPPESPQLESAHDEEREAGEQAFWQEQRQLYGGDRPADAVRRLRDQHRADLHDEIRAQRSELWADTPEARLARLQELEEEALARRRQAAHVHMVQAERDRLESSPWWYSFDEFEMLDEEALEEERKRRLAAAAFAETPYDAAPPDRGNEPSVEEMFEQWDRLEEEEAMREKIEGRLEAVEEERRRRLAAAAFAETPYDAAPPDRGNEPSVEEMFEQWDRLEEEEAMREMIEGRLEVRQEEPAPAASPQRNRKKRGATGADRKKKAENPDFGSGWW